MILGPLTFLSPWLLVPLVGLPVLWWLLRVTPPAPRKINFPAVRLLMGLKSSEETPARTPWWLLLLRMMIVALVLVGLAGPLLNPAARLGLSGPLLLVIDDGWAAGPSWQATENMMQKIIGEAARTDRPVRLLFTARRKAADAPALSEVLRPADARQQLASHSPASWPGDRAGAAAALEKAEASETIYFSDGTESEGSSILLQALTKRDAIAMHQPEGGRLPLLLLPPTVNAGGLQAKILRAGPLPESTLTLRATAADGRILARETATLPAGQTSLSHDLRLPAELRNTVTRLQIENESSAATTVLLDEAWRRRPVGLVGSSGADQPLLGEIFYLKRAFGPFAEVREGDISALITQGVAMIVLADIGNLSAELQRKLVAWMEQGGVLLRFAGENLANAPDDLLPVKLRHGERDLGGALSWTTPLGLRGFPPETPLAGLPVPTDILVKRQVLAEPTADLSSYIWANLSDGTPLITGKAVGKGWLALVHTTANADWSNLPLSGLYVDLLRRMLSLSSGATTSEASGPLLPIEVLDGLGNSTAPTAAVEPVMADAFTPSAIGPAHPPGFYGREGDRQALNLTSLITSIAPQADISGSFRKISDGTTAEFDLKPWLLMAALLLLAVDMLLALRLRGLMVFLLLLMPHFAHADTTPAALSADTYLAFVVTGDSSVDASSEAGLRGLAQVLRQRTAVEPKDVMPVDLEHDDLSFYPLLYWPVTASQPDLGEVAREKVNRYLKNGGMIFFDLQDGSPLDHANADLIRLGRGLDLPPLAALPQDHVLTRSFYLLQNFPGRYATGTLWVEANPERRNDTVSSIIVGSNDWASAWAVDRFGRAAGEVRGGERQRETARRFGVNLIMYALAGNYKSDQIHVPAILERLGK